MFYGVNMTFRASSNAVRQLRTKKRTSPDQISKKVYLLCKTCEKMNENTQFLLRVFLNDLLQKQVPESLTEHRLLSKKWDTSCT